ncbi:glycine--tRNA ligase subunit beta [Salinispirillum sp. LH 10-3-1]|uniref:Glycine--tRNA ligase beta subunit n=1 Tax=Salinispirillum sp. LH 10-3-1 TaxID=2952525 RepID=A0AB38YG36_9GAMM
MSQATRDFLFELGTEELPPKSLRTLSAAFEQQVVQALAAADLSYTAVRSYAAPRRLAIEITALQVQQADRTFNRRGPALQAAYDKDGNPTKAAEGFARSCGISVAELGVEKTDKGDYLVHEGTEPGQQTTALLPNIIEQALNQLPVAKRMRWGAHRYEFVRPVKWLLALWGEDVLPLALFGLQSSNTTRGHRIHAPVALPITKPSDYHQVLAEKGFVLADFAARKAKIEEDLLALARQHEVTVLLDDALLDEVNSLNEWPVALSGQFDERFLDVPAEALMSSMQEHQKYFPAVDASGKLVARFFFIANIASKDPSVVIHGNEKVIRPRLSDAAFFWETDQKTPLEDRLPRLEQIVFQKQLGTLREKSSRVETLAGLIAQRVGADAVVAQRGAKLAKTDLVTDLVFEFADLQGLAGYYYAQKDGEAAGVPEVIRDQYRPAFAGDALPETLEGCVVALADRLDTLTGIFGIGLKPTGTKDPYALRRAALGVLRILVERELELDLAELLALSRQQYGNLPESATVEQDVLSYVLERFRAWYQDADIDTDVFYAVRALNISEPLDIQRRVMGVSAFKHSTAAASLAEANKRVANLLSKATDGLPARLDAALLQEPAEQALLSMLPQLEGDVGAAVGNGDYESALKALSALKGPLDQFFSDVMVMADDAALRAQRLALLANVRQLFLQVADISLLQV